MDSETPNGGPSGRENDASRVSMPAAKGRALISLPAKPARAWPWGLRPSHGAVAAAVAGVMGLAFVGGTALFAAKPQPTAAVAQAAPAPDQQMDVLRRVQGEVQLLRTSLDGLRAAADTHQTEETVRALKRSVDLLKTDLEGVKASSGNAVTQLGAKLDKLDRDPGPKLAEISSRLDRVAELTSRMDRIERQLSSVTPTGSIASSTAAPAPVPAPKPVPAAFVPSPTGPLPPARVEPVVHAEAQAPKPDAAPKAEAAAKPDAPAKPAIVDGWLLRDVYDGVALVEGRSGLREVSPGQYVPGVGEIRAIERRGRAWVVVTSRGLIQADNRW